jgi:hypothetical protein
MEEIIAGIIEVAHALWDADERPEARRFTIICGAILVSMVVVLWWCLR